ncbi:Sodium/iodide co-transporter [Fulvivirga imtechensis AK7]|uniref:Sodium/iodide co-transporter n=1 Tax=Fulvivirga imtechensis AK7 TaxID=1237149 RepID=L8JWN5_9BACT|nr:sodium:solute symporter [Fulvivirga imtechensis]ELR72613.1 Sodium/iodide co-transporter [Fulvivirga imtechensis AK7]
MSPSLVITVISGYFILLIAISLLTGRKSDSKTFFTANRQSPWYLVAFGMIGASLSGVTFISVPGWVAGTQFSYMQVVFGYLLGYFVIATVLMPLYYRLNLVSIYGYLDQRFGFWSYKTGAFYFLLSRVVGASFRLFLVAGVLQLALFDAWGIDFAVTVMVTIVLIWLYTFRGGIKTIVWTDTLQTLFMLSAVGIVIYLISQELSLSAVELTTTISESKYSKIFFWDWQTSKNFFKQFFAGAFIAIVMTGLDQDMMQKNLTCKNIGDAQKNMFWFSLTLVVVNLMFLALGALLYIYADTKGIAIPVRSDDLFPMLALEHFNIFVGIIFLLGIVAAAYSSADSALTALTTSFCVDFLNFNTLEDTLELQKKQKKTRLIVHVGFSALLFLVIMVFKEINDEAVISAVFTAAGYTYGPLLGLYAFGLFTNLQVRDYGVPIVCVLSPVLSYLLSKHSEELLFGYRFGFEILIVNGAITFIGLLLLQKNQSSGSVRM